MRLRIIFLPVISLLVFPGCETMQADAYAKKAEVDMAVTQSDRLVRLATDIEARGEEETAIVLYRRAIALPDAKPSTFVKAGEALMRAGYADEAIAAYHAALSEAPDNGPAMMGLGSAMIDTGDLPAGIRALSRAAPIVNTSKAYNRLAVAQIFAGETGAAQGTLKHALALAPGDLDIQTNMALAAALEGSDATAVSRIEGVLNSPDAQLHHKRNAVLAYGLLGQSEKVKSSPPIGLSTEEVTALLSRAKSIRTKNSVQAKAKALGSMSG
ncbi:tetratricopeptide repeat protein [Nitratireductor pacificus]|uniref:TPR repeat-containing protein n=1 Tax=Nitratireductor pacificus pht-3B TaxID=391937 RepID=K2LJ22_9HYPH|nr:tetratricopeptide repeat protein [Nitratireductor pacificus]EKF17699.1 hypothetical protein NA2_16607 [Nitratireductor pacificus pht-3B]